MRLNAQQVSRHEPDEEGDHVETHGVTVLDDACQAVACGAGRHEPLDGEEGGVGQRVDEVIVEAQGLGYVTTQEGVGEALYAAGGAAPSREQLERALGHPPGRRGVDSVERHKDHEHYGYGDALTRGQHPGRR